MEKRNQKLWNKITAGRITLSVFVLFLSVLLAANGCQKRQEQPQQQETQQQAQGDTSANQATTDTAQKADTANQAAEQQADVPDLKGTWTGRFDQRATTLKINQMNGNDFKGTITINYREVINQQVSGSIDPQTKRVTMRDLLHSRFQGKYSGKVSDDMKKLSGTFTMNLDGSKFNFNLTKK